MKLILLSSGLGNVSRGIEMWMVEVAQHLRDPGIDIELWSGGRAVEGTGCPSRSLHALSRDSTLIRSLSWHRRYAWEQISMLPATIGLLRSAKADVAYCGDPVLSWHLKRSRAIHGARIVFMNGMRLGPTWWRNFDGVHLLAPGYLEQAHREIGETFAGHVFAVPHFVDIERFRPASREEKLAARARFKLPPDAFAVLTIGPLGNVSGKRLEHLAGEVAQLPKECILVSAGVDEDGADAVRAECKRLLGDRIRLLGRVDRQLMPELFRAADVYSLGSLAEPFSIAILEALGSGLPVVHHRDEVMTWQSGQGGVVVDMTETGSAASAIQRIFSDRSAYEGRSREARILAEQRYAAPSVCRQLAAELIKVGRQ